VPRPNLDYDDWKELSVFYEATAPLAFRIAQRSARSFQDAEDAVHDAYIKIAAEWAVWWRNHDDTDARAARLRLTLAHIIADLYRKKYFTVEILTGQLPSESWPDSPVTAEARDPDTAAAYRQVCQVIACMPQRRREVAVLHWLAGFERHEVAEALGISRSTVRVHLSDALKDLSLSAEGRQTRDTLRGEGQV